MTADVVAITSADTVMPTPTGFILAFLVEEPDVTAVCFEPVLGWICGEPVTPSTLKGQPTTDGPWGVVYPGGRVRDPSLGWFDDPVKWGQRRRRHHVRHHRRRGHRRVRDDNRRREPTEMLLEREMRTHGEALTSYDRGEADGFCLVLE